MPMLTFAQKRGNTTFYEWRTGKAPTIIERPIVEEAPADIVTEETVSWSFTFISIYIYIVPIFVKLPRIKV